MKKIKEVFIIKVIVVVIFGEGEGIVLGKEKVEVFYGSRKNLFCIGRGGG